MPADDLTALAAAGTLTLWVEGRRVVVEDRDGCRGTGPTLAVALADLAAVRRDADCPVCHGALCDGGARCTGRTA